VYVCVGKFDASVFVQVIGGMMPHVNVYWKDISCVCARTSVNHDHADTLKQSRIHSK
jgi:hypothetical protein